MKKLLVSAALSVVFSTSVSAQELITNGGFETGDLTGWTKRTEYPYTENQWYIVSDTQASGLYSGFTPWNYQIQQDIDPTPVSDIQEFSISAKVAAQNYLAVTVYYEPQDGQNEDYSIILLYGKPEWGNYDLVSQLNPEKTLISVKVSGYEGISETGSWYDDISVRTFDVIGSCDEETLIDAYNQGFAAAENYCLANYTHNDDIQPEIVEVIKEVEVPIEVIKTVEVIKEVEVPVTVVKYVPTDTSVCSNISTLDLSKNERRVISNWCRHINKFEQKIYNLISGERRNNQMKKRHNHRKLRVCR